MLKKKYYKIYCKIVLIFVLLYIYVCIYFFYIQNYNIIFLFIDFKYFSNECY